MNIEFAIEEIVRDLRSKSNLKENTLLHYEKHSLRHLVNYFKIRNISQFTDEHLKMYLTDAINREKKKLIKPRRLREIKRVVYIIQNYLNGIEYFKTKKPQTKLYLPDIIYNEFIISFKTSLPYESGATYDRMEFYLRFFLYRLEKTEIQNLSNKVYHNIYLETCDKYRADLNNVKLFFKHLHTFLTKYYALNLTDPRCYNIRKKSNAMIEPYTLCEIQKMINVSHNVLSKRNIAIFYLALTTGLRACDIKALKFSDIDWANNILNIKQMKTGKELILPLEKSVMLMIQDYIMNERSLPSQTEDKEIIFLTSMNVKKQISNTASLDAMVFKLEEAANVNHIYKRSFHSIRRFFATNLINNGIELSTVSQLLGHCDFSSDKYYISFDKDRIKNCAKGFDRIPIKGGVYHVE